ncbi:Tryptophan synthase beta subunit-like PLP-dependent enzyme [Rhizoctonia solani]|uniref:threonine synthase n=1 Tax=Rhizoctonia solani TaxID=456999 RepID=A0A8H7HE71_9AGAM|nr:Tryptophan synthase beta subunit-like PLP-dependent enzyme [Rhizoctonia solani]
MYAQSTSKMIQNVLSCTSAVNADSSIASSSSGSSKYYAHSPPLSTWVTESHPSSALTPRQNITNSSPSMCATFLSPPPHGNIVSPCVLLEPTSPLANTLEVYSTTPTTYNLEPLELARTDLRYLDAANDEDTDLKEVQIILHTSPFVDKNSRDNTLPFVLYCYSQWAIASIFEPRRMAYNMRDQVIGQFSSEGSRVRTILIANVMSIYARNLVVDNEGMSLLNRLALAVQTRSSLFMTTPPSLNPLDKQDAIRELDSILEILALQLHTQPTSDCIRSLDYAAPVFRRACTEPIGQPLNLPSILMDSNLNLRHFAYIDIMANVTLGKSTYFQYETPFSLELCETMSQRQNSCGLVWLYGVPDQFILLFAWINNLSQAPEATNNSELVAWIESNLSRINIPVDDLGDPSLRVGRVLVQECWRFAVLIYLYMALCKVTSEDNRVVRAHASFMRLVRGVQPARHPDSYLVSPMVVAGVATINERDRDTLRQRIIGVRESAQPGTAGNDVMMKLEHIWARTRSEGRAAHSNCGDLLDFVCHSSGSQIATGLVSAEYSQFTTTFVHDLTTSDSYLSTPFGFRENDWLVYEQVVSKMTIRYFSTRGGEERLTFEEAVLTGLAPNGGLYIPDSIPGLPQNWVTEWQNLSFIELAHTVLSLYIPESEVSSADLRNLVERSYGTFRHPETTPLHQLDETGERYILELFHGPTFAFKDVALQLLGNLFEYFLARRNVGKPLAEQERLTVVGATSGDTGSAAIYGLRGKPSVSIYILHPLGRVSPIQEAQMTTVRDENVHNLAFRGTFDDCQDSVKALFADKEFNAKHRLGAVNSINWARILAQTVYYFHAYLSLVKSKGEDVKVQFVVPTGNFGDVLAGWYASRMGLPVGAPLGIATNSNDILARFWATGTYATSAEEPGTQTPSDPTAPAHGASDGKQASAVQETLSPAMDILVSSNFERLLWYLAQETGTDAGAAVASWMSKVKSNGRVSVPVTALEAARKEFVATRVSDEETTETIKKCFNLTNSYIADPHTAVGLCAAGKFAENNPSGVIQVALATAHPAKFSEAVESALSSSNSFDFERDVLPEEFKGLLQQERRVVHVGSLEDVRRVIEETESKRANDSITGRASI